MMEVTPVVMRNRALPSVTPRNAPTMKRPWNGSHARATPHRGVHVSSASLPQCGKNRGRPGLMASEGARRRDGPTNRTGGTLFSISRRSSAAGE